MAPRLGNRLASSLFFCTAIAWTSPAPLAANSAKEVVKDLPFRPGDTLQVRNNAGTIRIHAWNKNRVEARWTRHIPSGNPDHLRIRFVKIGQRMALHAYSYGNAGESADLALRVPAEIDLDVRGIQPEILVQGVRGPLRVGTLRGSVRLVDTSRPISVLSRAGDIDCRLDSKPFAGGRLVTDSGRIQVSLARQLEPGLIARTKGRLDLDGSALKSGPEECVSTEEADSPCLILLSRVGDIAVRRGGPERALAAVSNSLLPRAASRSAPPPPEPELAPPPPPATAPLGDFGPALRIEVDWVHLNVIVRDTRSGQRISGLGLGSFELHEDEVRQQPLSLQEVEAPLRMLLLLDVSDSAAGYLGLLKQAVRELIAGLRPDDQIAIAAFNRTPKLIQDFTSDRAALEKAVDSIQPGGGTGFYRALDFALDTLRPLQARKALVLFTDGVDDTLAGRFQDAVDLTFEEVFRRVQETDALVYPVFLDIEELYRKGLRRRRAKMLKDSVFREARLQIQAIAEHSGSPFYAPSKVEELSEIFAQIGADLRNQYTLSYHSNNPARDGRWRTLRLAVPAHPDYAVRTRKGYFAPAEVP